MAGRMAAKLLTRLMPGSGPAGRLESTSPGILTHAKGICRRPVKGTRRPKCSFTSRNRTLRRIQQPSTCLPDWCPHPLGQAVFRTCGSPRSIGVDTYCEPSATIHPFWVILPISTPSRAHTTPIFHLKCYNGFLAGLLTHPCSPV